MSIQEKIENELQLGLSGRTEKYTKQDINNLKFLKAELQRGKDKVVSDDAVIKILVGLVRSQQEMQKKVTGDVLSDSVNFVRIILGFIPDNILNQIFIHDFQVVDWIERNIDFSQLKNRMQAIKIVQKQFPYIDGNLIKDALKMMEDSE